MTKQYVLLWRDHHADPSVHVFTDKEVAIASAKAVAQKHAWSEEDYKEMAIGRHMGWVFYATYGPEGDSVTVIEVTLDRSILKR